MNDHYDHALDPCDLTLKLNRIKYHSIPNDGDYVSRLPRFSRTGAPSSSPPRTVHKSATMSTTGSSDSQVSRFDDLRCEPSAQECKESVEVGRGEFSKPRIGKRRKSHESEGAKSEPEFRYYGRHANSWLFNDFSVTDSVRKGWGKVFSGKGHQ